MPEQGSQGVQGLTCGASMFRVSLQRQDGILSGQIANACFDRVFTFRGLDGMLLCIDDLCEALQFPQSATEARFLHTSAERRLPRPLREIGKNWKNYSPYEWLRKIKSVPQDRPVAAEKEKETVFLLHVVRRQNATMQGLIVYKTLREEKAYFRSALELMRMIERFLAARG